MEKINNFPDFEWLLQEKMGVDWRKAFKKGSYTYKNLKTGEEIWKPVQKMQEEWANGYFSRIRYEFFKDSEPETLQQLLCFNVAENYFKYYDAYMCRRMEKLVELCLKRDWNETKLSEPRKSNYDEWLRLKTTTENEVREFLVSKTIMGHTDDSEVDLVLFLIFDKLLEYKTSGENIEDGANIIIDVEVDPYTDDEFQEWLGKRGLLLDSLYKD